MLRMGIRWAVHLAAVQDDLAQPGPAEQQLRLGAQRLEDARQRVQRAYQEVAVLRRVLIQMHCSGSWLSRAVRFMGSFQVLKPVWDRANGPGWYQESALELDLNMELGSQVSDKAGYWVTCCDFSPTCEDAIRRHRSKTGSAKSPKAGPAEVQGWVIVSGPYQLVQMIRMRPTRW